LKCPILKTTSSKTHLPGPDHRRSLLHLQAALRRLELPYRRGAVIFPDSLRLADHRLGVSGPGHEPGKSIVSPLSRESPMEYNTIAQAGRIFGRPRLFLTIDTLLCFYIICFVLWSGWIKDLGTAESYLWYAATTLNLISISLVSIWLELERRS
jgi:hypothetical protein